MESAHIWISIPICLLYTAAILGNCTILFFIRSEPSLHEPMYYFLSMLALSDLGLSISSLPTMLKVFLFSSPEISPSVCFAQEFFIHEFSAMESSVLLIMSFDRFVAICNPLRYTSILTSARVLRIGLAFALKNVLLILPFPVTLKRLRYCKKNLDRAPQVRLVRGWKLEERCLRTWGPWRLCLRSCLNCSCHKKVAFPRYSMKTCNPRKSGDTEDSKGSPKDGEPRRSLLKRGLLMTCFQDATG